MAFNGSGSYSPPGTDFPAVSSTLIQSSKYNNVINDIASALSSCIVKDGQTTITGNLPMATYRHTGVGDAAALTDYASANQVVDNALTYGGTSAAGTDTYAVSLSISPGAYVAGQRYQFKADVDNTGACTINFNSLGAKSIKMLDGSDPADSNILAGAIVDLIYDGTNFILLNPVFSDTLTNKTIDLANNTLTGTTAQFNTALSDGSFATLAGTETLTNKTLTTPVISSISNTGTVTLPTATTTLTGRDTTDTLTNKTINADSNTITNIENANIKAAAAIDATKIGGGTVSNTEFGYLNGVTGAIQTQIGNVVQIQTTTHSTYASLGNTGIPIDNTIPQNTEGTELVTVSITPASASSVILILAEAPLFTSGSSEPTILALFQDSTADALASTFQYTSGANYQLFYSTSSGSTSARTYKLRVGLGNTNPTNTPTGTLYKNGDSGGQILGGALVARLTAIELN